MNDNMTNCPNFGSKEYHDYIRGIMKEVKPTCPLNKDDFMDMVRKAKELKPEPIKVNTSKKYPKIDASVFNITPEDFEKAEVGFKSITSIIDQFIDEKTRAVDKVVFDCFRSHIGCQKADDVFIILTSPVMFTHYNNMVSYINEQLRNRVGPLGSPDGMQFIELQKLEKPIEGSREMLESLRSRWDELYNEEGDDNEP